MQRYTVSNGSGMPTLKPAQGLSPEAEKVREDTRMRQQLQAERAKIVSAASAAKPLPTPDFFTSFAPSPTDRLTEAVLRSNFALENRRLMNETRDSLANMQTGASTAAAATTQVPSQIRERDATSRTATPEELAAMSDFARYLSGGAQPTPGQTTVTPPPQLGFGGFGMQDPLYRTRSTIGGTARGFSMGAPLSAWEGM